MLLYLLQNNQQLAPAVVVPTSTCLVLSPIKGVPITPATMVGTGGTAPYVFSASGLPPGLVLDSDGTLHGTPTTVGTFNYTVNILDAVADSGTIFCILTVTTFTPPPGAIGAWEGTVRVFPRLSARIEINQ